MSREFIVTSAEVAASLVIRMLRVLWNSDCLNEAGAGTDEQPVVCLEGCIGTVLVEEGCLFVLFLSSFVGEDFRI